MSQIEAELRKLLGYAVIEDWEDSTILVVRFPTPEMAVKARKFANTLFNTTFEAEPNLQDESIPAIRDGKPDEAYAGWEEWNKNHKKQSNTEVATWMHDESGDYSERLAEGDLVGGFTMCDSEDTKFCSDFKQRFADIKIPTVIFNEHFPKVDWEGLTEAEVETKDSELDKWMHDNVDYNRQVMIQDYATVQNLLNKSKSRLEKDLSRQSPKD